MRPVLWFIAALLIAGAIVFLSSLKTRRLLPRLDLPEGEALPRTALQKLAGRALAAVVLLSAVAAGIVTRVGPQHWWQDDAVRLTVTLLLLVALGVHLAFAIGEQVLAKRRDGSIDERDIAIINRSYAGVGGALLIVLAAWMIGLGEAYSETRLIPSYFLYLIFWSCVMTNSIATIAGVLLAYRRG